MTPISIIPGTALTASLVGYYTVPSGNATKVQMNGVRFVNTDSVSRTVTLHVIPSGDSATDANVRFKDMIIPAGLSLYYEIDDVMLPGTVIQAKASVTGVVMISASGTLYP